MKPPSFPTSPVSVSASGFAFHSIAFTLPEPVSPLELAQVAGRPRSSCQKPVCGLRGFTLVELLAVITIIGILAAIIVPVVSRVRESARAAQCASNLRQTGSALYLFINDNRGAMPFSNGKKNENDNGNTSWMHELRPYVGLTSDKSRVPSMTRAEGRFFLYCPTYEYEPHDKVPGQNYTGYKWNAHVSPDWNTKLKSIDQLEQPSTTVVCWDSLCIQGWDRAFPSGTGNGGGYYEFAWRHGNRSHFLFLDGHVKGHARGPSDNPTDYPNLVWKPEL
ncbi:MAG: prepilin-type N-terminal cleavage/methylation domain-containing protein [Opitutaceae bacterium]|jgi:general secretion pathway protein G|nr:prepilin-type N-terminal cleavage/methylation domain-containing protein [Opitutaceae bacterium]